MIPTSRMNSARLVSAPSETAGATARRFASLRSDTCVHVARAAGARRVATARAATGVAKAPWVGGNSQHAAHSEQRPSAQMSTSSARV